MPDGESLENACEEAQRRIETSMKSVAKLTSGLKAGQKAARAGDLNALHKALGELEDHLQVVKTETMAARVVWCSTSSSSAWGGRQQSSSSGRGAHTWLLKIGQITATIPPWQS